MWGQGEVFPVLHHTWSPGTNSWICSPRGNSTLSCINLVTWFITLPSCSICCEISSPLTWGKFVLQWEGASHTQFHTENSHATHATVGSSWVWAEPLEASPPRSSQSLRSTWRVSLLSVWLVRSTIPELWGLYAVCNFHLRFRALHTCWIKSGTKAGRCLILYWLGTQSGDYFSKQTVSHFICFFIWGGEGLPPSWEGTYHECEQGLKST